MPGYSIRNRGDGTFEEVGLQVPEWALRTNGLPVASMGADFSRYEQYGLA